MLLCSRDNHYYSIQSDHSQILAEKETVEKVYSSLLEEHRALKTNFDDFLSEKEAVSTKPSAISKAGVMIRPTPLCVPRSTD